VVHLPRAGTGADQRERAGARLQGSADFGDRDTAWARGFFAALARFRQGVYVNFLGGDEDPDRVREAYGDSVYDRLVDVKTTYDPDNVFHHNQNIQPGTGTRISGTSRARPH